MNGTTTNGHHTMAASSDSVQNTNFTEASLLTRIHGALDIVHSPYSSNDARKEASIFLEDIKAEEEAPYHGFNLANDRSQQSVVRHYALSLLEYAIKHRWPEYSESQAEAVRGWVLQLSEHVSQEDPLYLRNKTAQLWVEIAKRSWAGEWLDMDELLVRLWEIPGPAVHKEFVLFVLETLSDEIFNGEDPTAALREGILSRGCVEIFTPAIVLAKSFPNRQLGTGVRYGDEGWLVRLGQLLDQCLDSDVQGSEQYRSCAVKTLAVFKSAMPWAIPNAIAAASCVKYMCKGLAAPSAPVQMVCHTPKVTEIRSLTHLGIYRSSSCSVLQDSFFGRGIPRPCFADVHYRDCKSSAQSLRMVNRQPTGHRRRKVLVSQEIF